MMTMKQIYITFVANMQNAQKVLGMNRRNLGYVYPSNPRKYFEFANDKLLTKKSLQKHGLRVPETYLSVSSFYELQDLETALQKQTGFVIKPSSGSGGNGIMVITDYHDGCWVSISNKKYSFAEIKKHIADIIFGVYSFGLNDVAIIEERIIQNKAVSLLSPQGLADIRMINYRGSNVKAMLRIATEASDGKANLHQGGVGVAIGLEDGVTFSAQIEREDVREHPDTDVPLIDVKVPYWNELFSLCEETAKVIPMDYLGIDIALSENGPVVLEVNARPGIEIQNVSNEGMRETLLAVEKRVSS